MTATLQLWDVIYQQRGYYSLRSFADQFATSYFQEPREVQKWTETPGGVAFFQLTDGTAWYRVRFDFVSGLLIEQKVGIQ